MQQVVILNHLICHLMDDNTYKNNFMMTGQLFVAVAITQFTFQAVLFSLLLLFYIHPVVYCYLFVIIWIVLKCILFIISEYINLCIWFFFT